MQDTGIVVKDVLGAIGMMGIGILLDLHLADAGDDRP